MYLIINFIFLEKKRKLIISSFSTFSHRERQSSDFIKDFSQLIARWCFCIEFELRCDGIRAIVIHQF